MSEFKFACPVCGQHMMCDSSQGGSVMECPTCYQKIVAPQAPAPDAKFILTGTKLSEKKVNVRGVDYTSATASGKKFPAALVAVIFIALVAAGVGVFLFGGKFFHNGSSGTWQTTDVGNVGAAGNFHKAGGVFTLNGDGADIWDQADAFRYVFQKLTGDGSLTARLMSVKNTNPWAKAGVMFRDSLNADAKFVAALVTPSSGIAAQQRDRAGGSAGPVGSVPGQIAPFWVRVVRQGDKFSAYSSADGASWAEMGSTTIAMGSSVYVGLAVCSHTDGTLCEAQFDHVTLLGNTRVTPPAMSPVPAKPALVAPPASDTNWMLTLDSNAIPGSTVAGRIHGQDFIIERAGFQNGNLTLRAEAKGTFEFGVQINFSGAQPESMSGQTINVMTNAEKAARVSLRWKDASGVVQKENYDAGYALRLEFGALVNNRLPGKIYLCTPDAEKSYLLGSFNADARKPKPKAPPKK